MAAFFEPARNAVIPNITAREDIIVANTLSSTTWSVNLLLGAAIGGVVGALLGRDAVFVLNALSFVASALLISGMRFAEPHTTPTTKLRARDLADLSSMREGFRYVRGDFRLTATVLAKAGLLVIGPSWVLFTVMGRNDFPVRWSGVSLERGAMLGMSMLMAARGVGALLGPLIASPWTAHHQSRLRAGILIGFVAEAIGYTGLGFSGNVWVACSWIVLAHFGGSIVWVFSTTLLQLNSKDRFRGRVFAADNAVTMFTIAVGSFTAGRLLDAGFSARMVATGAGLVTLLPAVLWGWAMRIWPREQILSAEAAD
jgi:MFS family permease